MSLRRGRSNREATRLRAAAVGTSDTDLESAPASAFASEASVQRARDARRAQNAVGGEDSPLLRRTRTGESDQGQGLSGSLKKTKGRLRSMSETLTNLMTGRRNSNDDGDEGGQEADTSQTRR